MIKKCKKGFTLVELLVVIAIIGILAVVAVPNLIKNIQKSRVSEFEADYNAIRSSVLIDYAENGELQRGLGNLDNIEKYMENIDTKTPFGGIYYIEVEGDVLDDNGNIINNNLNWTGYRLNSSGEFSNREKIRDEFIVALRVGDEQIWNGTGYEMLSQPVITKDQFIKIANEIGRDRVYVNSKSFKGTNEIYIGIVPKN